MTAGTEPLTELPAWKTLKAHYDNICNLHLRKLSRRIRSAANNEQRGRRDLPRLLKKPHHRRDPAIAPRSGGSGWPARAD